MAKFKATFTFLDPDGDTSVMTAWMDVADFVAAEALAQGLAESADVISGAVITGVNIIADVDISTWTLKGAAIAGSDVEIGGRFLLNTAAGKTFRITVPGFKKDAAGYVAGGEIVSNQADINAFWNTSLVTQQFCDSNLSQLTALKRAYETFGGKE